MMSPFPGDFLHNHPQLEKDLNLPEEHVIIDRRDWQEAVRVLKLIATPIETQSHRYTIGVDPGGPGGDRSGHLFHRHIMEKIKDGTQVTFMDLPVAQVMGSIDAVGEFKKASRSLEKMFKSKPIEGT